MFRYLAAVAAGGLLLASAPAMAATGTIDKQTDLALNCGALYSVVGVLSKDADTASTLKQQGSTLLDYVDAVLKQQGWTGQELDKLGRDRTLQMYQLYKNNSPVDFTADQCSALLADVQKQAAAPVTAPAPASPQPATPPTPVPPAAPAVPPSPAASAAGAAAAASVALPGTAAPAAAPLPRITDRADELLSCAAGFQVAVGGETDASKVASLKQVAGKLRQLSDAELQKGGFTPDQISTVSGQYDTRIGAVISAGKAMPYAWGDCAKLAF